MYFINTLLFTGIITLLSWTPALAEPVTKPHAFTPGTPANAEEVNENFDILYNKANQLDAEVCNEQTKWVPLSPHSFVNNGLGYQIAQQKWQTDAVTHTKGTAGAPYIRAIEGNLSYVQVMAQVPLPEKAVPLRMRLFAEDNSDIRDIRCSIKFNRLSDWDRGLNYGRIDSSGAEVGIRIFEYITPGIRNTYSYDMVFNVSCDWTGDDDHHRDLGLYGFAVEYSLPSTCQ